MDFGDSMINTSHHFVLSVYSYTDY